LTILLATIITGIATKTNNPAWELGIPLAGIHLLWINLVTDSLPAFGLGMEAPDDEIMLQKPRPKTEGFFANNLALHIVLEGICVGLLTLTSYIIGETVIGNHEVGSTMAFVTLALTQLFHSYNVKSEHTIFHKSTLNNKMLNFAFILGFVLQMAVVYIPGVNTGVFQTVALQWNELLIAIGLALAMVVIMEVYKLVVKLVEKAKATKASK
jgi:Ca2+-transporting ATPase